MKKILFLHGFTSSGSCEIVAELRKSFEGFAEVIAPDIALHPAEAMGQLHDICDSVELNLIVGSSCGAFYGQQLVRSTGLPAILVNPFFTMTDFLRPRIGMHEYKSHRLDGAQSFEVTPELVLEFAAMEERQFDCYDAYNRPRVIGMFGLHDSIACYRQVFTQYYDHTVDFDGPHTMTRTNVIHDLVPLVRQVFMEFPVKKERYFKHFKGNLYRLVHAAKDSETLQRMVVYQALYGQYGYWVRPEEMFFGRVVRDGKEFPRFAEIETPKI